MSCESSWNQNPIPLPLLWNPSPAVFNRVDKSISFARKGFNMIQHSLPITCQSLGRETGAIQGLYPLANQLFVNVPNTAQNSNLLHHQVTSNEMNVIEAFSSSTDPVLVNKPNVNTYLRNHQLSSGACMIQEFRPATHQLSANVSNISQQSWSLSHQLPTSEIDINQNFNVFNQQLPINVSQSKHLPIHALSQNEFRRNQVKYPPGHQQLEREIAMSQGLRSIFGRHSEERLGILQNPHIPSHQNVLNQVSHPVSTNSPEMRFNRSQELLDQHLYPQYSEKVQICVVGPPHCGKADLIQTFARNDGIRISTDKPLNWVVQQGMVSFGTTLIIDIWYGELSSTEDIKPFCQSSKSVIVLVYNAAQKSTLLTVLEWIEFLKRDLGFKVPIILIGNVTDVVSSCTSKEFPKMTPNIVRFMDGVRARDEYGLAAFYECSTKCVRDVEAIFLMAAFEAFHRTL